MSLPDYTNRQREGYDAEAVLLAAVTLTAANDGAQSSVDIGENVDIEVVAQVRGAVNNADNTLDIVIEESDDDVTFTTLGSFVQMDNTTPNEQRQVFKTTKRYVRANPTAAGTGVSFGDTEIFIAS